MAFGANMSYRPQQLNFAVWCATTGCGISREALDKVPEQIKSFLMFHIYIKVRRILFEMGGIQSEWLFQVTRLSAGYIIIMTRHRSNEYAEFGISPSADFLFKEGDGHGLASVSVYVSYVGPEADHSTAYPGRKKFSDESGKAIKGVLLCSRTLLSSIFCCLLLHNFSLSVSFIKFFTEILFVQIYPLTTWTASLSILPLSITLRRFTSSLICHLARISYNVSTASNVHFALILQLISFVRWTYTSDFGPSS